MHYTFDSEFCLYTKYLRNVGYWGNYASIQLILLSSRARNEPS